MFESLSKFPLEFSSRHEKAFTLEHYLRSMNYTNDVDRMQLPMIVNIVSLNNYGRPIKNLLTKNSPLLLIDIGKIESILADYYPNGDVRSNSLQRSWLNLSPNIKGIKSPSKFRTMKRLSKSVVSLASNLTTHGPFEDNEQFPNIDDQSLTLNQRVVVRALNEKRPSSNYLCRVPIDYHGYFEILDENDRSMRPVHQISDLILTQYDENDPERRIQRWPQGFFLRSPCVAYKKRTDDETSIKSNSPSDNLPMDIETQSSVIILSDEFLIIKSGEVLTIINECRASRQKDFGTKVPENSSDSNEFSSRSTRMKSRFIFSRRKKDRPKTTTEKITKVEESFKSVRNDVESFLRCETEDGSIVYVLLDQTGLFTPINSRIHGYKFHSASNQVDTSGIFRLTDLLSSFRFPISVRIVDPSIRFENIYSPAIIRKTEAFHSTPTKLRLLMPYEERVVFVCPLNLVWSKQQKLYSSIIIIPISTNADILIQPCRNMKDISQLESFHQLLAACSEVVKQYQTNLSLIHFPLRLNTRKFRMKNHLLEQRSQSESHLENFLDEKSPDKMQRSFDQLDGNLWISDGSVLMTSTDRNSPIKEKKSKFLKRTTNVKEENFTAKINSNLFSIPTRNEFEDEIYRDLDKIYDYVRSGDVTPELEQIQAQNNAFHQTISFKRSSPVEKKTSIQYRNSLSSGQNLGTTMTHRFPSQTKSSENSFQRNDSFKLENFLKISSDQGSISSWLNKLECEDFD